MNHPNAILLEKIYAAFGQGDARAALEPCAENASFQIAGKSSLAGKFDKSDFAAKYGAKISRLEVHDILANDHHATVLASHVVEKGGAKEQIRTVHVWRFEGGKPVAFYEYPRDMYQYDSAWA